MIDPAESETQPRGQKELLYKDIPVLSSNDVLPGWGFVDFATETRKYFLGALTRALQKPDWLLVTPGSEEYEDRKSKGLLIPQSFRPGSIEAFKKLLEEKNFSHMAESIESMADGFYGITKQDIVIRALEIMSEDYPNLSFFRETSYGKSRP